MTIILRRNSLYRRSMLSFKYEIIKTKHASRTLRITSIYNRLLMPICTDTNAVQQKLNIYI